MSNKEIDDNTVTLAASMAKSSRGTNAAVGGRSGADESTDKKPRMTDIFDSIQARRIRLAQLESDHAKIGQHNKEQHVQQGSDSSEARSVFIKAMSSQKKDMSPAATKKRYEDFVRATRQMTDILSSHEGTVESDSSKQPKPYDLVMHLIDTLDDVEYREKKVAKTEALLRNEKARHAQVAGELSKREREVKQREAEMSRMWAAMKLKEKERPHAIKSEVSIAMMRMIGPALGVTEDEESAEVGASGIDVFGNEGDGEGVSEGTEKKQGKGKKKKSKGKKKDSAVVAGEATEGEKAKD